MTTIIDSVTIQNILNKADLLHTTRYRGATQGGELH